MKIHLKGERDRQALRRKLGLWKMVALYRLLLRKDPMETKRHNTSGLELDEETAKQLIDKKNTLRDHPEKVAGTFVKPDINDKKVMDYSYRTKMRWKNTSSSQFHVVIKTMYRLNQERKHKSSS